MKAGILIIFLLFSAAVLAQPPEPFSYVNDFAGVLPDKRLIEDQLVQYEKNTTIEIVVVTLDSVPEGYTLLSYGVELFDKWSIGKLGEDNGILLLVVKNGTVGNRMRIELGYGIQGYITGAEAGRTLDEALPYYEAGDYQGAVATVLVGLSSELESYTPGQEVKQDGWPVSDDLLLNFILPNLPIIAFFLIFVVSAAMHNRCPYCVRGKLSCSGGYCICKRCGRKVTNRKRYAPFIVGGGSFRGGGGFGGGSSGGGGAGR